MAASSEPARVGVVALPPTDRAGCACVTNRAPLAPSRLIRLPIGSIVPRGWLRHQLDLEAHGMTGHLPELSKWCKFDGNAWADPHGQGHSGWEELPYWLKGYGDLGYVLKDETVIKSARKWIDAVLASQEQDGYFGPRANKTGLEGKPDLWPHMVMLNVLQSFYEFRGDDRVLPFMTGYFRWLNAQPPETFGRGYWPKLRFGDTIESVYWLYNRTGESWLLDLARKIHENMARWNSGVINWHNVNISQGFREPGVFFLQARDPQLLQAAEDNYKTVMDLYGQFPGGGFAGDENCRPGFGDPRQGFETCGIVEFMHSFEMLTKISGNPVWADRCEELAFNSLPAAMTPDLKGLHYLTCANQIQLDRNNKSPGIQNSGTMFSYSPFEVYRCCQHNVSHGWPYYAEELWLATSDGGLCASLFAASEATARVGPAGAGTSRPRPATAAESSAMTYRNTPPDTVKIIERTDYPFDDIITFEISATRPVSFPLYLRIPRWCADASVAINGRRAAVQPAPLSYLVLERTWHDSDQVQLRLPMRLNVPRWEKNANAASIDYGPLTFSLSVGERWSRCGGTDAWPEYEVFPTTPWNYALVLDEKEPAKSFEVVKKHGVLANQPFTPESAPITLRAKARRLPAWKQDTLGLIGKLPPSPAESSEPVETVTLIPMGAARLRVGAFPVISPK